MGTISLCGFSCQKWMSSSTGAAAVSAVSYPHDLCLPAQVKLRMWTNGPIMEL